MPVARALTAAAFVAAFSYGAATTLRDAAIASDASQYLDGEWGISNGSTTFGGLVPGDLLTDMEAAGLIGDPLYEINFLTDPIWDRTNWSYSSTFAASPDVVAAASRRLVFDGVKMAADILLNGQTLGFVDNSFLRYTYDVTAQLSTTLPNTLTVRFTTSNDTRNLPGRWSACSGGVSCERLCVLCVCVI